MNSYVLLGILIVLFDVSSYCSSEEFNHEFYFLNDFIENEQKPSILMIKTCWSQQKMLKFLRFSKSPVVFVSEANDIQYSTNDTTNKIWFIINMKCSENLKFIQQVRMWKTDNSSQVCRTYTFCFNFQTNTIYFGDPYNWILFSVPNDDATQFLALQIWLNSNVFLASYNEVENMYSIEQIYRREHQPQQLIREPVGNWSIDKGMQDMRSTRILSRRRQDLWGMQFRTSAVITNKDSLTHLNDFQ